MSQFRRKINAVEADLQSRYREYLSQSDVLQKAMGLSANDLVRAYDLKVRWRTANHFLRVEHAYILGEWHYFIVAEDVFRQMPDDEQLSTLLKDIQNYCESDDK